MENELLTKLFKSLGYSENQMKRILSFDSLKKYSIKGLYKKINEIYAFLLKTGYSEKDIVKMTSLMPSFFDCSVENLKNKQNFLLTYYNKGEMLKITKRLPAMYAITKENIIDKVSFLKALGLTDKDIHGISVKFPSIFALSKRNILDKTSFLKSIGLSGSQIIKVVRLSPSILGYSDTSILDKINNLLNLGLTKEQIINIIDRFPNSLELSTKNMEDKINLYSEVNVLEYVLRRPECFIQSITLSKARIEFLNELNLIINQNNLFLKKKNFLKRFNITSKELLERYNKDIKVLKLD